MTGRQTRTAVMVLRGLMRNVNIKIVRRLVDELEVEEMASRNQKKSEQVEAKLKVEEKKATRQRLDAERSSAKQRENSKDAGHS